MMYHHLQLFTWHIQSNLHVNLIVNYMGQHLFHVNHCSIIIKSFWHITLNLTWIGFNCLSIEIYGILSLKCVLRILKRQTCFRCLLYFPGFLNCTLCAPTRRSFRLSHFTNTMNIYIENGVLTPNATDFMLYTEKQFYEF